MNREIGGYLSLENIYKKEYYDKLIDFNSSRNALRFIISERKIKKIYIPVMNCDVVMKACLKENVKILFYNINNEFFPILEDTDTFVYIVNYYGMFSNKEIKKLLKHYPNMILDNTHSFFQTPINGIDTIYNCRKYFGVSDGAYLSTKLNFNNNFDRQSSKDMYGHLLGRFEEDIAENYYMDFRKNDLKFDDMDIKLMSKISKNIMGTINYKSVKKIRINNFKYLDKILGKYNKLKFNNIMTFMYPLLIDDGEMLKKNLIEKKIFIPTLWPNVIENTSNKSFENLMARNLVLIPIDQRYNLKDMDYISNIILKMIGVK